MTDVTAAKPCPFSVLFCRVMAAHLALSDVPYQPIETEEESR